MTGAFGDVSRKYLLRAVDLSGWVTPVTAALPEQIAALIVDQIQFGEIKPGEPIREQQLADRFGVSRGPVRSALRLLVRDRLVVLNDNRGATVRSLSDEDTIAIFHIRAEVSGMILRLAAAAEQKDPTALDAVRQGVELLIEIADSGEEQIGSYISVRRGVSILLSKLGGNAYLAKISAQLEHEIAVLWAAILNPDRRKRTARLWWEIYRTVRDGLPDEADTRGRNLVLGGLDEVLRNART
jgi:DNA-binding GntR family transcriptional regulator